MPLDPLCQAGRVLEAEIKEPDLAQTDGLDHLLKELGPGRLGLPAREEEEEEEKIKD